MQFSKPKVLLVSADADTLELMGKSLASEFLFESVNSISEALRRIEGTAFQLCVSELHVAGGSGLELAKALRDKVPGMGRILIAPFADAAPLVQAIDDCLIARFIPKPFTAVQLRSAVKEYFRTPTAKDEANVILVADDSRTARSAVEQILVGQGFQVIAAEGGQQALEILSERDPALALIDLEMPGMNGLQVLAEAKRLAPQVPLIVLSGHAQHHLALDSVASGAFDFMRKPATKEELLFRIKRALNERRQRAELTALKAAESATGPLVAESSVMRALLAKARAAAATDATVLISGETGSGKDALAREVHRLSTRSTRSFLAINCGALPEALLESELFGHEKGAFTGAFSRRKGYFEMADGGTLFLDEVGEMSAATQVKLLRVLEEQQFARVGGTQSVQVNVRVIAATNRDLKAMVLEKSFREDLFYRLFVVPLHLPTLRERREDIRNLMELALKKVDPQGRFVLGPGAVAQALEHHWPGNVRELFNCIARAAALAEGSRIDSLHLMSGMSRDEPQTAPASVRVDRPLKEFIADLVGQAERDYLRTLLEQTRGNLGEAAARAGLDRKTIYNKMKAYGLTKNQFKASTGLPEEQFES